MERPAASPSFVRDRAELCKENCPYPGDMTTTSAYTTALAAEVASDVLHRFLRYVQIDTQADENSATFPSRSEQLDLSRLLVEELHAIGVDDAEMDEHGYVIATLPPTGRPAAPVIGFLAHVDTSPEAPGAGVKPRVVTGYDGGQIDFPGDPDLTLSPIDSPPLADCVGKDVVTSDGTTLLGADDKAGVAAIMCAAKYLVDHPEIARGPIHIAFTLDEEVGHGVDRFDIERFGATVAYTIDGSTAGSIEDETFSARQATVTFVGRNTHPGYAKGKLLNSLRMAAAFIEHLPIELSPERTEGRDGFLHPWTVQGGCDRTTIRVLARDFDMEKLDAHVGVLRRAAEDAAVRFGGRVEVEIVEQYLNMKEHLVKDPRLVALAERAIEEAGLTPRRGWIRGGTDGSRLTELGLPTPNLFSGAHEIHSTREWVCVHDMADAVATIVHLARLWGEEES